jgi:hypothetical protein
MGRRKGVWLILGFDLMLTDRTPSTGYPRLDCTGISTIRPAPAGSLLSARSAHFRDQGDGMCFPG